MALILPRNYHKITAVEHLAFEDVTYWPELVELINKARHSCASTLGLLLPLALGCRRSPALQSTQNQEQDAPEQVEPADLGLPALPTRSDLPRSPSGAHYPLFLANPDQLAQLLSDIELAIRNPDVSAEAIPSLDLNLMHDCAGSDANTARHR